MDPPTFDIAKSYADSVLVSDELLPFLLGPKIPVQVNTTPLIFILSPGTDPVSDVIRFAEQQLGVAEVRDMAMPPQQSKGWNGQEI